MTFLKTIEDMNSATLLAALFCATVIQTAGAASTFREFVTVKGDHLLEGAKPFRFISFNIPNLHLVEDNMVFDKDTVWRWPDKFETLDALQSVRQQGGTVVRTYVLSVLRTNDAPGVPRHILGRGKFNEEAFQALDLVMQTANETGVRVIIPFVDNWSWWGGIAEYAGFRGKQKEAFWTDPEVIGDFKETIRFLINRTNTLTGVSYRDDKAILAWETGNELQSPAAWTREIATFIKSQDRHHLVIDGFHTTVLREESLSIPDIDVVTTHHYPGEKKTYAELVHANQARAKGKKPYFVGEFGFVETSQIEALLDTVIREDVAGALLWSLRPRSRDGGFYWHSEPAGGDKYKAYHWPGFTTGIAYDETQVMELMRRKAFEIRGLPLPSIPAPYAPKLLPIQDAGAISWQGVAGAASYVVERAASARGPWTTAADAVDETAVQYRPLFADVKAGKGSWYYRVSAKNASGKSKPSNIVGPVKVTAATLLDEMMDFSQMFARQGALEFQSRDTRKAKEDMHRLAGQPGSALVYKLDGSLQAFRLDAFFMKEVKDFAFSISADGKEFRPVQAQRQIYFSGEGDYGYWQPVRYSCNLQQPGALYLKIEFAVAAQISRAEIKFDKK